MSASLATAGCCDCWISRLTRMESSTLYEKINAEGWKHDSCGSNFEDHEWHTLPPKLSYSVLVSHFYEVRYKAFKESTCRPIRW